MKDIVEIYYRVVF